MDKERENRESADKTPSNKDQQAIDKSPGEEVGNAEQVTQEDLKGKKVDADPSHDYEQPIRQLP